MIDLKLPHLLDEIEAGERRRDRRLESLGDQIERYHGRWYNGEGFGSEKESDPENQTYSYLSAFIPATIDNPPQSVMTSRRPTAQRDVARALQAGTNRWVRDTRFIDVLEELAYDYYFRWFAAYVTVGPRPEHYGVEPDPILMPQARRLRLADMGWDAMASHPERARIQWHRWRIDKEDLIEVAKEDRTLPRKEREGWNLKEIRDLQAGYDEKDDRMDAMEYRVDRDELELIDVYLPEHQPDPRKGPNEGFNGSTQTISLSHGSRTRSGKSEIKGIRPPAPHFGPSPYVVAGAMLVPDKSEPLSPLVATQEQSDSLNAYVSSMIRDAEAAKNVIAMSGIDPQVADRIASAGHNEPVFIPDLINLREHIAQFPMGGVDPIRFPIANWFRDMLQRVSGFDDTTQGQVTGVGTATEVSFAQDAAAGRSEWPRKKFVRGVERILTKVAHFMYLTDQIIFPLGREGQEMLQEDGRLDPSKIYPEGTEAIFFGGNSEEGSGGTFQDLELTVKAGSMLRTSSAEKRRKSEIIVEFTTIVLPQWAQIPGLDLRYMTKMYADYNDVPELVDGVDFEVLTQTPQPPTPMLSKQAGSMSSAPGFYERAPILDSKNAHPATQGQAGGQGGAPGIPAQRGAQQPMTASAN